MGSGGVVEWLECCAEEGLSVSEMWMRRVTGEDLELLGGRRGGVA